MKLRRFILIPLLPLLLATSAIANAQQIVEARPAYREIVLTGFTRARATLPLLVETNAGVQIRLQPILLTTLTTTPGLLPMALGIPSYSLIRGTMASTFVTGLATATFLSLFIVPVEWDLLMAYKERRTRHNKERLRT